jgi:hypothetical protein
VNKPFFNKKPCASIDAEAGAASLFKKKNMEMKEIISQN